MKITNRTISFADEDEGVSVNLGERPPYAQIGFLGEPFTFSNEVKHVIGSPVEDLILGDNDANILKGRAADDQILGLGGDDILRGNKGDDRFNGGEGDDRFIGGPGNDIFDMLTSIDTSSDDRSGVSSGKDTIRDFTHGEDRLWLGFVVNDSQTGEIESNLESLTLFDALDSNKDGILDRNDDHVKGESKLTLDLSEAVNVAHDVIREQGGKAYDGPVDSHSVTIAGVTELTANDFVA